MKYEQFSVIYNALKSISSDESLNQDNVIGAIKSQLPSDSDAYKEWAEGKFSLDHVFTTVNDYGAKSKHTLLTCACKLADLKVVDLLLKVGASVNVAAGDENPFTVAIESEWDGSKKDAKAIVDLLMKEVSTHVGTAGENNTMVKAVERGNLKVFEALIEAGASLDIEAHGMTLLEWAEEHQPVPKIKKEDMEEIINTLKAPSEEKKQNSESTGKQLPVNGSNKTPEKNNTTFWSEHKWKIALSVVGLCTAGAIAAYMLAYPAVALALTVLATVILIGAGIDKFCEKSESPNTKISDQGVSSYANEKIAY